MEINFLYIFLGIFLIFICYNYIIINILFESNNLFKIIDNILTKILTIKIYIHNMYNKIYDKYFKEKGFKIVNIIVHDEINNIVTGLDPSILNNEIQLDALLYDKVINYMNYVNKSYNLIEKDGNISYIKIVYKYDENSYIFLYTKEMAQKNVIVPLPLYDEDIINNFKNDIISPYYYKHNKEASLYSLFHIDCKKIKSVKYNGNEDKILLNIINEYKGLLNDFGLMYKCNLKAKDILNEYQIKYLESLEIEFEAPYFDEITFDIIPHIIRVNHKDDYIISDRIKSILNKREKDKNI